MADTLRGDLSDEICSDCGEKGCTFKHWGPLVPEGEVGCFCDFCWMIRNEDYKITKQSKPLGMQPPGVPDEFANKQLTVTTESGSVYRLTPTENNEEWIISRDIKELDFTRAKILRLALGKGLDLKPRDSENYNLWHTSPVLSIECY